MLRRLALWSASGVLVVGLVACSSTTNGSTATTAAPSTAAGSTVAPTTTTAPTTTSTTAAGTPLEKAAIAAADLGASWVESVKADGYEPPSPTGCARTSGAALDGLVATEGRYGGAVFQRGTAGVFARATAFRFRDEAAAKAYIDLIRTDAYQQCRTKLFTDEEVARPGAAAGSTWRVSKVGDAKGTGDKGFELQISYQFQADVNGATQDANGAKEELAYRAGPVVVAGFLEVVSQAGDPADLSTTAMTEMTAALQAAVGRVRAA
jgi:hypothetical protein